MAYQVTVWELDDQPVLGIREWVPVEGISSAIGEFLPEVWKHIESEGKTPAGPPFTRYHAIEESRVLLEAGLPVPEEMQGRGRIEAGVLPGGEAVATDHFGPYEDLPAAGEALDTWIEQHDREAAGPCWEVYWTDPGSEPDPQKWRTEVLRPLVRS